MAQCRALAEAGIDKRRLIDIYRGDRPAIPEEQEAIVAALELGDDAEDWLFRPPTRDRLDADEETSKPGKARIPSPKLRHAARLREG